MNGDSSLQCRLGILISATMSRANLERTYLNVFLIEFDGEGRCRAFVEYYMKEPEAGA